MPVSSRFQGPDHTRFQTCGSYHTCAVIPNLWFHTRFLCRFHAPDHTRFHAPTKAVVVFMPVSCPGPYP
eukprot:1658027-Heterocapsa_arctica.AAC.1